MPTFQTPEPITATIELVIGDVRISAGDRNDTIVEVRPSDASNEEDVKAAELTRVEYEDKRLLVKAPKLRSWVSRSGTAVRFVTLLVPFASGEPPVTVSDLKVDRDAFSFVVRIGRERQRVSADGEGISTSALQSAVEARSWRAQSMGAEGAGS